MAMTAARRKEISAMQEAYARERAQARASARPQPQVGVGEAALRGAGQGVTFGGFDEATALLGTAGARMLRPELFADQTFDQTMTEALGRTRSRDKLAAQQHPVAFHGADFAGGMLLPAGALGKGASYANMAKAGAISGGVQGFARSEKGSYAGRLSDAGIGAGVGAVAAPVIGAAGKKIGQGVASVAGKAHGRRGNVNLSVEIPKNTPNTIRQALQSAGEDTQAQFREGVRAGLTPEQAYYKALGKRYNVRLSSGDITQDAALQSAEENALKGHYGDIAERYTRGFRDDQSQDIGRLVSDRAADLGMGGRGTGNNADLAAQITESVRAAAKKEAQSASAKFSAIKGKAVEGRRLARNFERQARVTLGRVGYDISPEAMPAVNKRLDELRRFVNQPTGRDISFQQIEQFRRRLLNSSPKDRTERAALSAIKHAYDDFIDSAIDQGLMDGSAAKIAQIKSARRAWAEYKTRYWGTQKDAEKSVLGKIIDNDMEPDKVFGLMFGSSEAGFKNGSGRVVRQIKDALGVDSPDFADLKAAGFLRLMGVKADDLVAGEATQKSISGVKAMSNVQRMIQRNKPLWETLYTPEEQRTITEVARLLNRAHTRQDGVVNYSNSANVIMRALAQIKGASGSVPVIGEIGRGAAQAGKTSQVQRSLSGNVIPESQINNTFGARLGAALGAQAGGQTIETMGVKEGNAAEPTRITIRPRRELTGRNAQIQQWLQEGR